jgi:hypothetical protein
MADRPGQPVIEGTFVITDAELRDLRDIAETMIPADTKRRLPGADDPAIQADIARTVGRDLPLVKEAIAAIVAKSGGAFAALGIDRREALINELYAGKSAPVMTLGRVILGAYYRDDRVLTALGVEPRSPFPKGYAVEQGDWSLLDAVRNRPQLWRDDR